MSLRLKCPSCQAAFLTSDDALGQAISCPKCGSEQQVPQSVPAGDPSSSEPSVWFPRPIDEPPSRSGRWRWIALGALLALPILLVAVLVAWPWLRNWTDRGPSAIGTERVVSHPAETAARQYLQALVDADEQAAQRLGLVEDPPAIRSFQTPRLDESRTQALRGSFAPIAALHTRIEKDYVYDGEMGRFRPRNELGMAAETLDALHATKEKAETTNIFSQLADPDPQKALDAIDNLAEVVQPLIKLSGTTLAPETLIPSYSQLVEQADPPLPPVEASLALDYGGNRSTWDSLLNRPFTTIRADGPFLLDRAEVVTRVQDRLSEPDSRTSLLRLTLTRFRLEGIDTGWKVTSARREQLPVTPAGAPSESYGTPPASTGEPASASD